MYVIDNTVLSNFAIIGKMELLYDVLKNDIFITDEVEEEFRYKESFRNINIKIDVYDVSQEDLKTFEEVLNLTGFKGLHAGEISCILSIISGKADVILTDDFLARKFCKKEKIKVHGTVFVLAMAVKEKLLALDQAENILNQMKEKGYSLDDRITVQMALKEFD